MALNQQHMALKKMTALVMAFAAISTIAGVVASGCNSKSEPEDSASPVPAGTPVPQTPDKMTSDLPGGGPPGQKK
ncbi:MAG: hypothetical protein EOO38_10705 [Cytophagaceae bacterium]|nr:MAG: hypothetical protein EOO38_10705 [Cytophagaceae bacterium]